jgi:hypothetical protein
VRGDADLIMISNKQTRLTKEGMMKLRFPESNFFDFHSGLILSLLVLIVDEITALRYI